MSSALKPPFSTLRRQPLYLQAKASILQAITAGAWKPGEAIPSEAKLSAMFGIAVGTVRHAVDELVEENVLVRRHGFGTFIKSYADSGFWNKFQRFQSTDGCFLKYRGEVLSFERIPAPPHAAEGLSIPTATPIIHIRRRLFTEDSVRGLDELFLNAEVFQNLTEEAVSGIAGSVYRFYEREMGVVITDAQDSLEAVSADAVFAAECGIDPGVPCFRLTRTARTFGRKPVEYRIERCIAAGLCIRFD